MSLQLYIYLYNYHYNYTTTRIIASPIIHKQWSGMYTLLMLPGFSIRTKLILAFVLMYSIPIAILSFSFYKDSIDLSKEQNLNTINKNLITAESTLKSTLNKANEDLISLGTLSSFKDYALNNTSQEQVYTDELVNDLYSFLSNKKVYKNFSFIESAGYEKIKIIYEGNNTYLVQESDLINISNSGYFLQAKEINVEKSYLSFSESGDSIIVSKPLKTGEGNIRGVISLSLKTANILESLQISQQFRETLILINDKGSYITQSKSGVSQIKRDYPDSADLIKTGTKGQFLNESINSYITFTHANLTQFSKPEEYWVLMSIVEKDVIEKDIRTLLNKSFSYIAPLFLVVTLFAILLSGIISRPINHFKSTVEEIILKGNLDKKVDIKSKDEIGYLAGKFNELLSRLKDYYDNLEKKVKENTSEIRKFQQAVEASSDGIIITDTEAKIIYVNPKWELLTGYKLSEVQGKNPNIFKSGKTHDHVFAEMWNALKNNKEFYTDELVNKRKDGTEYSTELAIAPVTESGKTLYFVGVSTDITKRKEVDRMKSEFISLASHQLRTPLSAMRWFLEMLLDGDAGELNPEQRDYISNVYQANSNMIELVNALLNVSRIESGRIIIDPIPTDLAELIKSVVNETKVKYTVKKQSIVVSIHHGLPKINLDPKLIRHVFLNLITNAIKYSPERGEIHIFVSKNDKEVLVQVSDTGFGIPEAEKSKVFQKFYRGSNIVKYEIEGTGLGLYLAKAIIESSKGRIWFESEEGKGTSFWFSLPLVGMEPKQGEVTIGS